jgi:hypothetical protein
MQFVMGSVERAVGPVHEAVAHEFSREFYGNLAKGLTLGQAVLRAKRAIVQAEADSNDRKLSATERIRRRVSTRSYSAFGHPNFAIQFTRPSA